MQDELKFLGKNTNYEFEYNKELLDCFDNKLTNDILVKLEAFEFTTLCPITGQPDYAKIYVSYVPNKLIVESKSLKLYLNSFRNKGNFHEQVIDVILNDLKDKLSPKYLEVYGLFASRGGISINPFVNYAEPDSIYEDWYNKRKLDYLKG